MNTNLREDHQPSSKEISPDKKLSESQKSLLNELLGLELQPSKKHDFQNEAEYMKDKSW
jgi:hypothetical protein